MQAKQVITLVSGGYLVYRILRDEQQRTESSATARPPPPSGQPVGTMHGHGDPNVAPRAAQPPGPLPSVTTSTGAQATPTQRGLTYGPNAVDYGAGVLSGAATGFVAGGGPASPVTAAIGAGIGALISGASLLVAGWGKDQPRPVG